MKLYVRSSKYANVAGILFSDRLVITVELPYEHLVAASTDTSTRFPGIAQFKEDVLHILVNEYNFEVIEDVYDGVRQQGYISNRDGSPSIYFDTYFDLHNAGPVIEKLGVKSADVPEGQIYCFIHIRFSEHDAGDYADKSHIKFVDTNAQKYASRRDDIKYVAKDEQIIVPEPILFGDYTQALDDIRYELDHKIFYWLGKAKRGLHIQNWSDIN